MANHHVSYFAFAAALIVFGGCCGPVSSSSSCTTYGEACTEMCDKAKGTQFDAGPNCFSDCTAMVRQQGFGDATTCCKVSISQRCQSTCSSQWSKMSSNYGADPADKTDFIDGCMAECTGPYEQMGIPLDHCGVIDPSSLLG